MPRRIRLNYREMIAWEYSSIGEHAPCGSGCHYIVRFASKREDRDRALAGPDTLRMDYSAHYNLLCVRDRVVNGSQFAFLSMPPENGAASGDKKDFRTRIWTRKHDDTTNACELVPAPITDHPRQESLDDETALTMRYEDYVSLVSSFDFQIGLQVIRENIVIRYTTKRTPINLRR